MDILDGHFVVHRGSGLTVSNASDRNTLSRENPSGKPSRGKKAFEPGRASAAGQSERTPAPVISITMPSASIDEGVGVDANDDGRMEEGAVELGGPGDAPNREGHEGASVPHPHAAEKPGLAVFNLSSAIIGAGIMAIPNAFRVLGVLGGVLALVAMHVVTGTTVRFLVRATEASGAGTYAACAARFCGDAARVAVQLAIVLNNFGIMVVYQIIFGDVLAGNPADLRDLPVLPDGPGSDAEDYADYDDNATRVYPPPLPPAAPPSDEDDEDAAPAALLPWAFARAGGSCRVPVAAVAPNGARVPGPSYLRALAVPDDGAIGWGESSDTFISHALDGWAVGKGNGGNPGGPDRHSTRVAYETAWYCTRPASIAYVVVLVCAPLCLMRSLKALAGASFVSVACAANFVAVLLFKFAAHVVEEFGDTAGDTASDTAGAGVFGKIAALTPRLLPDPERTSVREAISVIAVMTTAYVCHFMVHPLYAEMDHPRSPERFERLVARRSLRLCTSVYVGVGTVAFALFGDGTHADVLVDFRRNTALDQAVVKGGYVASLALTYPVLLCVMREVLVEIFMDLHEDAAKRRSSTTATDAAAGDDRYDRYDDGDEATSDELREHLLTDAGEEERVDGDEVAQSAMRDSRVSLRDPEECAWRLSRPAHVALTLSIIAAQFLLAIVTPDIEVALGFMGSTLSVFVAFAAPAMIAIGVAKEAGADGSLAWAVLAFGVLVGASGLTVATWNAASPPE